MERLTIKNSDGTYSQPTHTTFEKMFYKLAEFEDFMEEMCFEDLEHLKLRLENLTHGAKYYTMWEELKEFVKEKGYCIFKKGLFFEIEDDYLKMFFKMQELEKGEINGSK